MQRYRSVTEQLWSVTESYGSVAQLLWNVAEPLQDDTERYRCVESFRKLKCNAVPDLDDNERLRCLFLTCLTVLYAKYDSSEIQTHITSYHTDHLFILLTAPVGHPNVPCNCFM